MAKKDDESLDKQNSQWETEAAFVLPASLEDLLEAAPFHKASDIHGHSYTAGTRLPEWMRRVIKKLVETEGTPYELESDVLRDAIYIGLQVLNMRYQLSGDWEVAVKMAKTIDQTGVAKRIKTQFEELCYGLNELYDDGDVKQASQRLSEYVMAATGIENDWHRDRLFRLIREDRFVRELATHCNEAIRLLILGREKDKGK